MEDNTDIALLAACCERDMRNTLGGSSIKYNRTDFRRFLGNGQPVPMPQNQYPQYNPYPHVHQQSYAPAPRPPQNPYAAPVDPYIPEGVIPPSEAKLLPVPQTAHPSQQNYQGIQSSSNIEPVNSFQIPDYNAAPRKSYLEDEEQFRNALIEEIKSLKNNIKSLKTQINKLQKIVEHAIIPPTQEVAQPIETENDSPDKS